MSLDLAPFLPTVEEQISSYIDADRIPPVSLLALRAYILAATGGSTVITSVKLTDASNGSNTAEIEDGRLKVAVEGSSVPGFDIPPYTRIDLTYNDGNVSTVTYKSGVTTVATLTLSYDLDGNVSSVVKS